MQETSRNVPDVQASEGPGRLVPRRRIIRLTVAVVVLVAAVAPAAQASVLHRAVKAGDLDGVTRVLAAGTDVNARDKRGRTALMYAVDKGYVLLVGPLLAAQADPNVRGPDGATALYIAAAHGHSEIITMLMQAGADPTIKGPMRKGLKGRTPMDVARAQYGDPHTALKQGEPPAVIALLAGKTWAEGEEFVRTLAEWPPGKTFRDCELCPELVLVPPGDYMMGSPSSEAGRDGDEGPVHQVTIAEPFAVGKYEVTFADWNACVEAGGCTHRLSDEGWGRGRRPVINVSWNDAQEYVKWLSRETGQSYRLLSEAEWEYVARAGTQTKWYWGESATGQCAYANGSDLTFAREWRYSEGSDVECDDGYYETAPVGNFKPNAFGLFDTAGNVDEWVADCWHHGYVGAPNDGSVWTGGDCDFHVVRGGSYVSRPEDLRSAVRDGWKSGYRGLFGLRVARTLTP